MDVQCLHRGFARARTGVLALAAIGGAIIWPLVQWTGVSAAETSGPEFTYSGDSGPGFWGETPGWEACGGTAPTARQSPVNIDSVVVDRHLGPLHLQLHETPLALINNGHTIEEEYEPGSQIILNGVAYDLTQFHFHTLSEHTVAGHHGAMELHAVFADPGSSNKAVVGMLFVIGKSNRFLDRLLAHGLPKKSGEVVDVPSEEINLADALTNTSRYYTYPGSLTTPPCSETVTWFVLHDYAQLSSAQLEAFRGILGNDFRPLQKRNGRVIRSTVGDQDHQH
jgi:carbonic anhydrase